MFLAVIVSFIYYDMRAFDRISDPLCRSRRLSPARIPIGLILKAQLDSIFHPRPVDATAAVRGCQGGVLVQVIGDTFRSSSPESKLFYFKTGKSLLLREKQGNTKPYKQEQKDESSPLPRLVSYSQM